MFPEPFQRRRPAQLVGNKAGQRLGAVAAIPQGHPVHHIGILPGETNQLNARRGQFRGQQFFYRPALDHLGVPGHRGQGDEGMGFAAAEAGVEAVHAGPIAAAVAEPVENHPAGGLHRRGRIGAAKKDLGRLRGGDFVAQGVMQGGGVIFVGGFRRPGMASGE